MNTIRKYLGDLALLPLYLVIGLFFYWAVLSFMPLTKIYSYYPEVISGNPGQELEYAFTLKFEKSCASVYATQRLIPLFDDDDHSYVLGLFQSSVNKSKDVESITRTIEIPSLVRPGKYRVVESLILNCNPYDLVFPQREILEGPVVNIL